ncbi:MAG: aldolase [Methanomicrobiales archaeon]|nr:aldolase [Methanomicrobiales archaeon]
MRDRDAERIGIRLHAEGLVRGNFGNISIREDQGFYIKRRNAYLDAPRELIFVPQEGAIPEEASRETIVHREIYRTTPYRAVVHAHPPHAIALSYISKEVRPQDCEGELLYPRIKVVEGVSGTHTLARTVAAALQNSPAVIVRGHGTFAAGASLDEAYVLTSAVEHACRILILLRQIKESG